MNDKIIDYYGRGLMKDQLDPLSDAEPPVDPYRLLIDGIVDTCTDEMIRLYVLLLINPTLDDSFRVENMRRNRKRVLLKFNKKILFDEIAERQKKVPDLCSSPVLLTQVKIPNTIRVTNVPNSCSRELLNLYFSNSKVSRGGDIKSIKVFSYENKALITFKNYNRVEDVLMQSHVVCEQSLTLEKYFGPIEDEYFREEDEIDGTLSYGESIAESKFLNSSPEFRLKRNGLSTISFSSLKPSMSSMANNDKTKIIISNIQENICIQQLDFLIQLLTGRAEISEINWSLDFRGKLLIDFKQEIDMPRLQHEFNSNLINNLNGKKLQLETVNLTRTIVVLVKDLRPKKQPMTLDLEPDQDEYKPETIPATRDLLDLYFSNRLRSGGGDVESIHRKSSRYWLIVMKELQSIKEILSRKHVVDEKQIKVFPYYENFGLPYLFKPIFDDHLNFSSSTSIFKLKIKDERLRHFCRVKNLHKKFNEILSESNAISKYNKHESSIIYVSYLEKLAITVPYTERIWRLRVRESIEYFLQVYKYEKVTLSYNQWAVISKTKISESLLSKNLDDESNDEGLTKEDKTSDANIRYIGNNCAIISINETNTNVEISIVGPKQEVEVFIVKIKDIICKAYFTFELEEKIIKFKTYLSECEELLIKWLSDNGDATDSDNEVILGSGKNETDGLTISYTKKNETGLKLSKSRKHTIDEFLSKLERDHEDMEMSYGKLFQELGYTFLNQPSAPAPPEEDALDENDSEYKEFNEKTASTLDEMSTIIKTDSENESQMDKIKNTLDDLKNRINEMRKKFRNYSIKTKRVAKSKGSVSDLSEDGTSEFEFEDNEDVMKLSVYVKDQGKILTFRIHKKCKLRELKQALFEKIADPKLHAIDNLILSYDDVELANDMNTLSDYEIDGVKATITAEFDGK